MPCRPASGLLAAILAAGIGTAAAAGPFELSTLLAPTDSLSLSFADGSAHVALMVRREGKAEGTGPFAGASVVEYGWHDLDPPHAARALGYIQLSAASGDIAYLDFSLEAGFIRTADGVQVQTGGYWTLVSGTGAFDGLVGAGTLTIGIVSETERLFVLKGEIGPGL